MCVLADMGTGVACSWRPSYASGPAGSNQVRADRAPGDGVLDLEPGYLPSAMTPMPSVLSVRRCLMARYSDDSYQALAAALVANLSTTVTCPADPSSSSESRSITMFSEP
jgi:hypothetical protein